MLSKKLLLELILRDSVSNRNVCIDQFLPEVLEVGGEILVFLHPHSLKTDAGCALKHPQRLLQILFQERTSDVKSQIAESMNGLEFAHALHLVISEDCDDGGHEVV